MADALKAKAEDLEESARVYDEFTLRAEVVRVADELRELTAGGGSAREKQAEAWGEGHGAGWNDCLLDLQNGGAKATPNPYRAASVRGEE